MVIGENKQNTRKDFASITKKSAKVGALVLGSALAVSSYSAHFDVPTVDASEKATVTFASTNNAFLDSIIPDAYELAHENDLYASVMIAQAVLESSWGTSGLGAAPYYNLFGIKGTYEGQGVTFRTLEDDGSGNYYQIRDSFRSYPSYRESLTDYVDKLKNGVSWDANFYSGTWKSNTDTYHDATAALTGTYATDTRYGSKLNNLISAHNLAQYDTSAGSTVNTSAKVSGANASLSSASKAVTGGNAYTVKSGDGLYTVARALGISVDEVKSQNGLTSNLIHPGQVLYGPESATPKETATENNSSNTEAKTESGKTYTVKAGDGLYAVARALGISVEEAREQNGGSDLIFAGDVFTGGTASEEVAEEKTEDTAKEETTTPATGKSYTVKAGDGLYAVARALGISVEEAREQNDGSNLIFAGDVFTGGTASEETEETTNEETATPATGKSYTVKAGDGLYTVARQLGISLSEARALNGGSDLIFAGDVFTGGTVNEKAEETTKAETATPTRGKSYTVKAGDGLYTVARQLGISLSEARALNGGSDLIFAGDVFTSGTASEEVAEEKAEESATPATGKSYTVKAGDGLYTVARQLGISLSEARALNGGSDMIHAGEVFTAKGSTAATPTTSSNPAKTSSPAATSSANSYTVKAGDGLYTVARQLGISLSEARALNGGSDLIFAGDVFTAKGSTAATPATSSNPAKTSSPAATSSAGSYTVKAGDGIYTVARALGISLAEARALNGGSDLIFAGDVFTAKGSTAATPATSSSPAKTSSPAATSSAGSYTVKAGDGIYTVARALGISLSEARALNGGSDVIHAGEVFTAGQTAKKASTSTATSNVKPSTSATASASTSTHTVKSGETLYRIAKNNGLSLEKLMTLNGLSNYNLHIGQVLKLK